MVSEWYSESSLPRTQLNNHYVPPLQGVQCCCFDRYTSYGVGNKHDKFQVCTVDVQAATVV